MNVDKRVADQAGEWLARNDCRGARRTPDRAALVVAVGAMLQHGQYGILGAVLDEFDTAERADLEAAARERELHDQTCGCERGSDAAL